MADRNTEEIADWLHGHRGPMLDAIQFYQNDDAPVTPAKIRDYSGVASGSFDHHLNQLANPPDSLDLPQLVAVDRREIHGQETRVFELTDEGERLLAETGASSGFDYSEFNELRERVDELERENAELREQIELVDSRVDEKFSEFKDELDGLREFVQTFINNIKDSREGRDESP